MNSCTVKNPSETAFMNLVKKGKAGNKKLVVAGCVPQGDRKINGLEDVSIVGISQIDRVTEIVEETLKERSAFAYEEDFAESGLA